MAKVGAQRAAELTGKSKSTIQRAMKTGKISCEVDINGHRLIDVAELDRVFGLLPQENERKVAPSVEAELEKATQMLEMERLKMRIKSLEDQLDLANERLDDVKEQRDQWQRQAQQVLLTSQYSQKQAEELKEELRERERRARIRRQQEMERRGFRPAGKGGVSNQNGAAAAKGPIRGPIERIKQEAKEALDIDFKGLWQKIKGAPIAGKKSA